MRRRRFVAFDVLTLADARVVQRSLEDGITLLTDLGFTGPSWCTIATWTDIDIADLLAACAERGAEGAIAKRLGSTYYPGQRRSEWRKIKTVQCAQLTPLAGTKAVRSARSFAPDPARCERVVPAFQPLLRYTNAVVHAGAGRNTGARTWPHRS